MIDQLLSILTDYTFRTVVMGTACLGISSGIVGSYTCMRQESLLADALSHAALPGIMLAFLLIGVKDHFWLLMGASVTGLIATGLIYYMSRHKVKFDSALSLVLSSFFGLGLALLSYINRIPNADQAGLENYIFGQASAMLQRDVQVNIGIMVLVILCSIFFWKEFKLFTFDAIQAKVQGFNVGFIRILMGLLLVLVIVTGLQAVGVILMSAFIIIPPTAARQWTRSFASMMVLSSVFGMVSAFTGTLISSMESQIPTGPSIVLIASFILVISLTFAPKRGLIARHIQFKRKQKLLLAEVTQGDDAYELHD